MSQLESNGTNPIPEPAPPISSSRAKRVVPRGLTLAAIVLVGVYLQAEARNLWHEWVLLRGEVQESHKNAFVGYINVSPDSSHAVPPAGWLRDEGEVSLLWSGWQDGVGHHWFRFNRGDIDPARISRPASYLISRPIDYPLLEERGGQIWQRIPSEAVVVGHSLEGQPRAYPVAILEQVQVINDIVQGQPFVMVLNPLAPPSVAFSVFKADLHGRRLIMGGTGYFHDGKPLLFDRGTESLWAEEPTVLRAVAGKLKHTTLNRLARLAPITWGSWLSQYGQSRLLVGADRSRGIPKD